MSLWYPDFSRESWSDSSTIDWTDTIDYGTLSQKQIQRVCLGLRIATSVAQHGYDPRNPSSLGLSSSTDIAELSDFFMDHYYA